MATNVIRLKYRGAPIAPTGNNVVPNQTMSCMKKVKPIVEEVYVDPDAGMRFEKPMMCVEQTQSSSVYATVASNEVDYRREYYPSYVEKVKEHGKYMKQKLRHEKLAQKTAECKYRYEQQLLEVVSYKIIKRGVFSTYALISS